MDRLSCWSVGEQKQEGPGWAPVRRAILAVAILNAAYFLVESAVAFQIGSVSLAADSLDFLEDAAISLLIVLGLGMRVTRQGWLGRGLALLFVVPASILAWTLWTTVTAGTTPAPLPLSLAALGALAVNLASAVLLVRHRRHRGSLVQAAWLSARNDALANVAILLAAVVTAVWFSPFPDLVVGIGILIMNADAALKVWRATGPELAGTG